MKPKILAARYFGVKLLNGLCEEIHIVRAVRFAGPVEFVLPFHGRPPHGVGRICVTVKNFICKNIVLILVRRPIINAQFRAESSIITAEVICAVQICGIPLLREGMILVHLQQHAQEIVLIGNGRIAQLFVVVPADNIAAGCRFIVITNAVVPYFDREKVESVPFVPELFEDIVSKPRVSLEDVRAILLQIRIDVQRHAVFQNRGKVFVSGDNIRQVTAGQS